MYINIHRKYVYFFVRLEHMNMIILKLYYIILKQKVITFCFNITINK